MEFEESLASFIKDLDQNKNFYASGYLNEKGYYKLRHRILDTIAKRIEEEQIACEKEINKLSWF